MIDPREPGTASRVPAWHEVIISDHGDSEMPPQLVPVADHEANGDGRLAFRSLNVHRVGLEVLTDILLRDGDRDVRGRAQATATGSGTLRSAALATVDAVNQLVAPHARFELEGLDIDANERRNWVRVEVSCLTHSGVEDLAGAALVRQDDTIRAAVRAVLDAVNRRLEAVGVPA